VWHLPCEVPVATRSFKDVLDSIHGQPPTVGGLDSKPRCYSKPRGRRSLPVDDEEVFEVVALSDISIVEDCEDSLARMTFHAKLAPRRPNPRG